MLCKATHDEVGEVMLDEAAHSEAGEVALGKIARGMASEAVPIKIRVGCGPSGGDAIWSSDIQKSYGSLDF